MKRKNKKLCGYLTVEAAFLMPVFLCIIALLCYLSFYMCNRTMLSQDAYVLALRGSLRKGTGNEEIAAYLSKQSKEIISKYFAVSEIGRQIKVSKREVTIELMCEIQVPFALFTWQDGKLMSKIWRAEERKTADRTDPVDFIRACRKIKKAIEK